MKQALQRLQQENVREGTVGGRVREGEFKKKPQEEIIGKNGCGVSNSWAMTRDSRDPHQATKVS